MTEEDIRDQLKQDWEEAHQHARQELEKKQREDRKRRVENLRDAAYFVLIIGAVAIVLIGFAAVVWSDCSCRCLGGGL